MTDFRKAQLGDTGFNSKGQPVHISARELKARQYFSPGTGQIISLRQYQKIQRGGQTYSQFVRAREEKGVGKRQYRTKGHTKVAPVSGKRRTKKMTTVRSIALKQMSDYQLRSLILKDAWAKKHHRREFEKLSQKRKTEFWIKYHELVEANSPPSYIEWSDYWEDYFDVEYDDVLDLAYGTTP